MRSRDVLLSDSVRHHKRQLVKCGVFLDGIACIGHELNCASLDVVDDGETGSQLLSQQASSHCHRVILVDFDVPAADRVVVALVNSKP